MGGIACKEKIILNGGTIESEVNQLCYRIQEPEAIELSEDSGYKMVELLNTAEDCVFQAKRIWLESQGFAGPWPHSLKKKGDAYLNPTSPGQ